MEISLEKLYLDTGAERVKENLKSGVREGEGGGGGGGVQVMYAFHFWSLLFS